MNELLAVKPQYSHDKYHYYHHLIDNEPEA